MKHREIDRKIAELMGYTMYHYDKDVEERCFFMLMNPDFDPVVVGWTAGERKTEELAWEDCPHFSSDWNAMRLLVEWLQKKKVRVEFDIYPDHAEVTLTNIGWIRAKEHERDKSAPLALCEVVLKLPTELLRPKGADPNESARAEGGNFDER